MSIAIVGTDTDVGKTVISALVAERFRSVPGIAYWKPMATGLEPGTRESGDRQSVRTWVDPRVTILPETYAYRDPVSPHLAARRAGEVIRRTVLDAALAGHRKAHHRLVVEGIGGVLVPMSDRGDLFADWLATTGLPALVVVRSTLGTINHSLLTVEALRHRGVPIAGVVMNGPRDSENLDAVSRFSGISPIFEIDLLEPLVREAFRDRAATFDPEGQLAHHLEIS